MEYITRKFENTGRGLAQKDEVTRQLAAHGYRIISEQIEPGHIKGEEQCCGALICLPLIFAAGRTPGYIVVTYGRESAPQVLPQALFCTSCGAQVPAGATFCRACGGALQGHTTPNREGALVLIRNREAAREKTRKCQELVQKLDNVLSDAFNVDHTVNWSALAEQYNVPRPSGPPEEPLSNRPDIAKFEYRASFLIKMIPSIRRKRTAAAQQRFFDAEAAWKKEKEEFDRRTARQASEYRSATEKWEAEKVAFDANEAATIDSKRRLYLSKHAAALEEYWTKVTSKSPLPGGLTDQLSFTYLEQSSTLFVDANLPVFDTIPKVQEVKYSEDKKTFEENRFPRAWQEDFYEELIHKLALKIIFELFQSDSANALEVIVFNGFVRTVDRAIGHQVKAYIISVPARKQDFLAMNLQQVDPKACVRRLNGRSSAHMAEPEPVEPVLSV
jgi:restriction system protein